jgi:hypothetical protein
MVLRMIATNSLAAFTAEISRTQAAKPARANGEAPAPALPAPAERRLDSLPSAPSRPMPRGSLLDLRV